MKLQELLTFVHQPTLYEKGTALMWTDPHISKQLLEIHLNPEIDLASRKRTSIEKTIDWIFEQVPGKKLNILDLGCGPGLYALQIAQKGHEVIGVDISEHSINYATEQAKANNQSIEYINKNYLELDLPEGKFDLVMMIYTDFGVLLPEERIQLLKTIEKALKPGGTLIFDVLNDKDLDKKVSPKNWEITKLGFWRNTPYLALSDSFFYEEQKVVLNQHIISEADNTSVYRFWTHFFSHGDLRRILEPFEFKNLQFYKDVLPQEENVWSGENVTFCKAIRI